MEADERAAMKEAFQQHWFCRVIKDGCEAILAIPRAQPTKEREARAELLHGATVKVT